MPDRFICIHGHFYQPPRENPWLEAVEVQDSAAPYHDWNARVAAECYAPNGASRILDADGRIVAIVDNYRWISFNVGPTLMAWLEAGAPDTYARILEADRVSGEARGGHGNAIAQAYNHMILPLATRRDKETQVVWGIADFRRRFGRDPEGMWLPETAADTETLDVLAAHGIAFTILAPHQAARVRPLGGGEGDWTDVSGARIDPSRAYRCWLPSGRSIALFFYDGPISRAVAFEGLLNSGDAFAARLLSGFSNDRQGAQLVHIATDGESYGHHHRFGEMALARALRQIEEQGAARLTNYGEFLAHHPPEHEVEIAEPTSWSCEHGVERWRANCGCRAGHPGWTQEWRRPLREALDWLRDQLAAVYEAHAPRLLPDPWAARDAYIDVILDRGAASVDAFLAAHGRPRLPRDARPHVLRLLEMQRHALLMYTSCGWFFDELSGIETVQVIKYAARAIQLAEPFGARLEAPFIERLAAAKSNLARWGDGAQIYRRAVRPSFVTLSRVVAHYAMTELVDLEDEESQVFAFTVRRLRFRREESAGHRLALGLVTVASRVTTDVQRAAFAVLHLGGTDVHCSVHMDATEEWYAQAEAAAANAFLGKGVIEAVRVLDDAFGEGRFTLSDLFTEARRRILGVMIEERLARFEGVYRQVYEESRPLIAFMRESDVPVPPAIVTAAEYTLLKELGDLLARAPVDPLPDRAFEIARELEALELSAHASAYEMLLRRAAEARAAALRADPFGPDLDALHRLLDLAGALGVSLNLWQVQNAYHAAARERHAALTAAGDAPRAAEFWRLGERLYFNLASLRVAPQAPAASAAPLAAD
jgi:alpha-amylase/alpha-mannosidase (GH57 family)